MRLALSVFALLLLGCRQSSERPATEDAVGTMETGPEPPASAPAVAPEASAAGGGAADAVADAAPPEPAEPPRRQPTARSAKPSKAEERSTDARTSAELFDDYGFSPIVTVEHLCGRRDFPVGGGQVTWDAFASDVEPKELIERFEKRMTDRGLTRQGTGAVWRLPPSGEPYRMLEILAPSAPGRHRSCDAKPGPGAKSVIVLVRAS
jgi:hypothetical protein